MDSWQLPLKQVFYIEDLLADLIQLKETTPSLVRGIDLSLLID